jgi:hypothetical protein
MNNCFYPETVELPKNQKKKYTRTASQELLCYNDYVKKSVSLNSYKVPQLKIIAKQHNLHVTGTKPALMDRISDYFNKTKQAILIQRTFRGSIVRYSDFLRGPAAIDRKLCVNDKDFVTLEPLVEINYENFFSYTDSKQFTYGFDINSIIELMSKNKHITNPYNREKFDANTLANIKTLHRLCLIMFENFKQKTAPQEQRVRPESNNRNENAIYNGERFNINNVSNLEQRTRIMNLMESRRNDSLSQRINNIFHELDQLGNYTQSTWFTSLTLQGCIRLYRNLYDIWYYRSQLTNDTRQRICPLTYPFETTAERNRGAILSLETIQRICAEVIENFIFMGTDNDHRQLGAFHSLTAMTIVSTNAREAMPWLYESIFI